MCIEPYGNDDHSDFEVRFDYPSLLFVTDDNIIFFIIIYYNIIEITTLSEFRNVVFLACYSIHENLHKYVLSSVYNLWGYFTGLA